MTNTSDAVQQIMGDLRTSDHSKQDAAYQFLIAASKQRVDWAYAVWDALLGLLKTGDNRQRAIAAQVLCSLAKSDPRHRIRKDLAALLQTTKDARFVTARHTMQSLWKVGVIGSAERELLVDGLTVRFKECVAEKNCTLIRYDILACLRHVYDETHEESLSAQSRELIELEEDAKYKKRYAALWRK